MTASIRVGSDDLERRDTDQNFQADLLINARTVGPRTTKFSILGGGVFLGGHRRPYYCNGGPPSPQFLGFPSTYAHTL